MKIAFDPRENTCHIFNEGKVEIETVITQMVSGVLIDDGIYTEHFAS
jgi:repressor of nif and glnA expression